jgi:hypothetical protein
LNRRGRAVADIDTTVMLALASERFGGAELVGT